MHVSRAALVAVVVAGIVLATMGLIHPLAELLIVFATPALVAAAFASGIRSRFQDLARVGALVSAFTGAAWLIVTTGSEQNVPAVLIGAMVTFLLMVGLAAAGAFLLDRTISYRSAWRS